MENKPEIRLAENFLSGRKIPKVDSRQLADACEQLILEASRTSLKRGLSLARRYIRAASDREGKLKISAYRMFARAAHLSGMYDKARDAYIKIKRMAVREPLVKARVDRALIDIYMYLGDHSKAVRAAKKALTVFREHHLLADVIQTEVNYANLLHRQDRHAEAEKLYARGADYFEKVNNPLAAARCYYNRANSLVQLFDLAQAEKLYLKAENLYESHGCQLDANDARYGLAWLAMLKGEFHKALLGLSNCETAYRSGGDPRGASLCALDRAETFINLGLHKDALETAREVEPRFRKLKMNYEAAKAALFRGQAAMRADLYRESRGALRRAENGFRLEKNYGFLGVTDLIKFEYSQSRGQRTGKEILISAGRHFKKGQLPLWEAVCDLKMAQHDQEPHRILSRLKENRAVIEVPHLYALWQLALGDFRMIEGETAKARRHWELAARRLDTVRASMPPVELRTQYGQREESPHVRLIEYELDRNPVMAAVWSERYKTAGIWRPLNFAGGDEKRRQAEESLTELAHQVGALARNVQMAGKAGSTRSGGNQYFRGLQRHIREKIMVLEDMGETQPDSDKSLIKTIGDVSEIIPAVQFCQNGRDLTAFIHSRGNISTVRLNGAVDCIEKLMQRWRFILESILLAEQSNQPPVIELESNLWQEMGNQFHTIFENIPEGSHNVLIVPEGAVANIPWQALIIDGKNLFERYNFIETPSLRHFWNARIAQSKSRNIEVFKGASEGLDSAVTELEAIKRHLGHSVKIHEACTRRDWPSEGTADIWHFTGHAEYNPDNPFYSSLFLEDGPLFAADFRLKKCTVNLVTLAACRTGEQLFLPGEESSGLVRSLLEMGARNVIAGRWKVSDRITALWMTNLYKSIQNGDSLLDAIRYSTDIIRSKYPSAYHWAAFALWGAGNMGGRNEL